MAKVTDMDIVSAFNNILSIGYKSHPVTDQRLFKHTYQLSILYAGFWPRLDFNFK